MLPIDEQDPVVVIGASVAGLFAARLLAGAQIPVEVCERAEQLAPRARTLIVTPELQRVLGFSPASATVNKVHTLELCTSTRTVPIRLREPDLIVERAHLIRLLADRAMNAGAKLHFAQDFTGLSRQGSRTFVELRRRGRDQTRQVAARAIVAADGVLSHVARSLGQARRPAVTVLQARVTTPASTDPGVGRVWFLPQQTQYFYWLCPESAHYAAVGLVDASPREARAKLDRFLAERGM
jgi:flavin-dependent dehydrogenase